MYTEINALGEFMKKLLCTFAALLIVAAAVCCSLVGCSANKMQTATKNGDTYTIVAGYDDNAHVLSATQTVQITNRSENTLDAIKFHIYANQYRQDAQNGVVPAGYKTQAYPNGESYGDIALDSVKADGVAVAYTVEGTDMDILSVPLGKTLYPDEQTTIEMTYQVTLANIKHRLGYTDATVNLGNFYPILCHIDNGAYSCTPYYCIGDPFVSDVANYNVTITLPQDYTVAATGNIQEANSANGNVTYTYSADAVRDFAMVLSKQYKKLTRQTDGIEVNYYYYADTDPETSLATACDMMQLLNANVGKYPYRQLSVAETEFCYGGMEYPNITMITSGSSAYREAIAHETAHQWFYGVVGNNQITDAWLDEGLCEFVTYLYMDKSGIAPLSQNMMAGIKTYTTYVDVLNRYYENVDRSLRPIDAYKNDSEYVIFTYIKGSLLFNTLYETMGEAKFWKALSDYYNCGQFEIATSALLCDCFAQCGGKELATIINSFVEGTEIMGKITD